MKISNKRQISAAIELFDIQVGDLLYWSNESGIHHAAIITEIKDGEIYYAAHSGPHTHQALSEKIGRETVFIVTG